MTEKIYWLLVKELGEEFLVRSRKQNLVIYRTVIVKIFKDDLNMGWTLIATELNKIQPTFFRHHSSIIHLYEMYEVYKNQELEDIKDRVVKEAVREGADELIEKLKGQHLDLMSINESYRFLA